MLVPVPRRGPGLNSLLLQERRHSRSCKDEAGKRDEKRRSASSCAQHVKDLFRDGYFKARRELEGAGPPRMGYLPPQPLTTRAVAQFSPPHWAEK